MSATEKHAALPGGTRVLNTNDGEPGMILNGISIGHATGNWFEYEVATHYGIERWRRSEFILLLDTGEDA